MKIDRNKIVWILSTFLTISILGLFATPAFSQTSDPAVALQHGYQTGHADGFLAGYKDIVDGRPKDIAGHAEYTKADRAYSKGYGTLEDYRDGYQQGFESGYDQGFDKKTFDPTLPTELKRRTAPSPQTGTTETQTQTQAADAQTQTTDPGSTQATTTDASNSSSSREPAAATGIQRNGDAVIIIPRDTEMTLELQNDLNTQETKEGTKFTAKVTGPSEIAGATVEGRVSRITKPGRLNGRSEMNLTFDRIVLSDNRWSNMSAVLTEVLAVKGDNVQKVDAEGTAIGQGNFKKNAVKVGVPAGAGALIGGIAGGPVGVAVGAGVGAAFGFGAVVVQRGKHIRLNTNQQLRVKTAYETQIR